MTRAGTIPLSDIEWIRIHLNAKKRKSTKAGLQQLLTDTGGDIIMNGAIFLSSGKPCCHLKADGVVKCKPSYTAWGISWNNPTDFCVERVANSDANYMECVHAIIAGKKIDPMNYGKDMAYACNRTAVGVKEGRFAYYCTEDNLTPEKLRDRLFDAGWSDAIMMDGGGSACCMDKDGNGFAGDGRYIPFYIVVKLKKTDNEPKGEKPMVEINAYSKKKDGSKKLSTNFTVKEFACKNGEDTVLVAPRLVMVLQSIRSYFGKSVTINSAYRTPEYNRSAAVGGVDGSQHCYGTAADIKVSGVTPAKVAAYARSIMPDWGGVGTYSNFTHIDVRETKSDWKG